MPLILTYNQEEKFVFKGRGGKSGGCLKKSKHSRLKKIMDFGQGSY